MKPHELVRLEGSEFGAECLSCGVIVSVSRHIPDSELPLRIAQLEHQVAILQESLTNRSFK